MRAWISLGAPPHSAPISLASLNCYVGISELFYVNRQQKQHALMTVPYPNHATPPICLSFTAIVKCSIAVLPSILVTLENKESFMAIRINEDAYQECLQIFSNALIGLVILAKGERSWTFLALKESLSSI